MAEEMVPLTQRMKNYLLFALSSWAIANSNL